MTDSPPALTSSQFRDQGIYQYGGILYYGNPPQAPIDSSGMQQNFPHHSSMIPMRRGVTVESRLLPFPNSRQAPTAPISASQQSPFVQKTFAPRVAAHETVPYGDTANPLSTGHLNVGPIFHDNRLDNTPTFFQDDVQKVFCPETRTFDALGLGKVMLHHSERGISMTKIEETFATMGSDGHSIAFKFDGFQEEICRITQENPHLAPFRQVMQQLVHTCQVQSLLLRNDSTKAKVAVKRLRKKVADDGPQRKAALDPAKIRSRFEIVETDVFKSVHLVDILKGWIAPANCTTKKQAENAFKLILQHITKKTAEIQKYTVRSIVGGEDAKYICLPNDICKKMKECALEMMGLHDIELNPANNSLEDLINSNSEYWRCLGSDDDIRWRRLESQRIEVTSWRSQYLEDALKLAIKAVRNATLGVDKEGGEKWIPDQKRKSPEK